MIFSKTYTSNQPFWEEQNTIPFDELILSWNGIRPQEGHWTFWVSLKEGEWLEYARWGANEQRSFKRGGQFAQCYQDVVTAPSLCTGFRIKVEGDHLCQLHSLTVCLANLSCYRLKIPTDLAPILLEGVARQSQQLLNHPRAKDLCSPTSITTALNYLSQKKIDPVDFAFHAHDAEFDLYGNWVLNVAEGYNRSQIPCHVERLNEFKDLHDHLVKGRPVVVSVKGALPGAAKPSYDAGHLMCVIGYGEGKVFCIDSAFADHSSTFVQYDLADFLSAWAIRRNLAYVFPTDAIPRSAV